ncbi:IQ domain-containing protein C-like [Denticeps clupeoides]|uniref:IQ domain-containing protein C n=1 Tax=Denticeps clupeoides TaxID=299321 RepID=A0A8C3Z9I4_9TELE|nr:IQ domain-containing protein C-like [Denticeps clupeoides]XP_028822686.1 IQ domain-containing protein C-like [Denticeps clupeoides]XP_028846064.1 IQ domain-containing protein C-like [Denticeps clupeoides]
MTERSAWLQRTTRFQARSRGYLVRRTLKAAQAEFEDIVSEVDGDLCDLSWEGTLIPQPRFSDQGVVTLGLGRCAPPEREAPSTRPQDAAPERDPACRKVGDGGELEMENHPGTSAWCSSPVDGTSSEFKLKALQARPAAEEVLASAVSLQERRSILTMELLWIQQAIASRKKYLIMKEALVAV